MKVLQNLEPKAVFEHSVRRGQGSARQRGRGGKVR